MRQIIFLICITVFLTLTCDVNAQNKEQFTYLYVENLSQESYSKWFKSMDKSTQTIIRYACTPAKIIGVKKEDVPFLKNKLMLTYKSVKELQLTQKEAEQKCANQRSF